MCVRARARAYVLCLCCVSMYICHICVCVCVFNFTTTANPDYIRYWCQRNFSEFKFLYAEIVSPRRWKRDVGFTISCLQCSSKIELTKLYRHFNPWIILTQLFRSQRVLLGARKFKYESTLRAKSIYGGNDQRSGYGFIIKISGVAQSGTVWKFPFSHPRRSFYFARKRNRGIALSLYYLQREIENQTESNFRPSIAVLLKFCTKLQST